MRRKFWIKAAVVLFVLLLLLYAAFWIALFNPLEGSIPRLDALVPGTVSWYVRGSFGELRKTELVRRQFLESPLMTEAEASLELEQYLYEPIRQMESQINASLPSFAGRFSVQDDLMGREIVIAGKLNGPGRDLGQKAMNSPYLVLTRISFKARFMEVLKYEAIRKNVPGLTMFRDFYQYDVGEQAIREGAPESARYFYFQRVKDVLILSNDRELTEMAVHFGRAGGVSDKSFQRDPYYYFDIEGPTPPQPTFLWMAVSRADSELGGELEGVGQPREGKFGDFVRAFFPVGKTVTVLLKPGIDGTDSIPLRGVLRVREKTVRHLEGLQQGAAQPIAPVVGAWASWLPGDRTFGLLHLKMAPPDFIYTILSSLDPAAVETLLGSGGTTPRGPDRWPIDRLASQLGDWFNEGVTIAWTRLPEADAIDLDRWEGGSPTPYPGMTFCLKVKDGLDPPQLVEFFKRRKDEFGFQDPEEVPAPIGRMYVVRVPTDMQTKLLKPAFAYVDHDFLFSSNADELARILAVRAGQGPALAADANFKEAVATAADRGNLFLYVDMDRARKFILDQRYDFAFRKTFFNEKQYRTNVIVELTNENRNLTNQQRNEQADRKLDEKWHRVKTVDFPDAIRQYRNSMVWYEPFRWITLSATRGLDLDGGYEVRLDLTGEVRLRPMENAGR